jgi:hypothetical protein
MSKSNLPCNPVARHINTFNKPSVVASKQRKLKSEATIRDAREDALNKLGCSQTITFESGSEVHWDESEDCLQGCMNSVNCSSIEVDLEEDEK